MSADTKIIRSVLEECKIGDTVTYEQLSKAIGRDVREYAMGSITSARRGLLNDLRIVFAAVKNVGYIRLDDSAIVRSMERDRQHIARQSGKAIKKLECVDFDGLSDDGKKSHTVAAAQFGVLQMMSKPSATKRIEKQVVDSKTLAIGETLKMFTT
jgi:hypothetical protein